MFNTFTDYLNSLQQNSGFLLCVFYKTIDSPQTISESTPQLIDVKFRNLFPLNRHLTLGYILKGPEDLELEFDYIAMTVTEPDESLSEANVFLSAMSAMLIEGEGEFLMVRRDGTVLNPSEDEVVH